MLLFGTHAALSSPLFTEAWTAPRSRAATLRAYCLSRLEDFYGELRERKISCRKVACDRRRLAGTNYCLEHLIAERFGRHLSKLEQTSPGINIKNDPL